MKASIDEIKKIVANTAAEVDVENLTEADSLTGAGVDSLDLFNILLEVEEEFGVKFPEDDTESFASIGEILAFVNKD